MSAASIRRQLRLIARVLRRPGVSTKPLLVADLVEDRHYFVSLLDQVEPYKP